MHLITVVVYEGKFGANILKATYVRFWIRVCCCCCMKGLSLPIVVCQHYTFVKNII